MKTTNSRAPVDPSTPSLAVCRRWRGRAAVCLAVLVVVAGCGKPGSRVGAGKTTPATESPDEMATGSQPGAEPSPRTGPSGPQWTTPPASPEEALERMVRVYASANEYGDQALVRLSYTVGGEQQQENAPVGVAFKRSLNALRVQAYDLEFGCLGRRRFARIEDPLGGILRNQFVEAECPAPATLDALLVDPVLVDILDRGLARIPIQLELLYANDALIYFRSPQVARRWLEPKSLQGRNCLRVAVGEDEEQFVFWIDSTDYLLRRLDYPSAGLQQATTADNVQLSVLYYGAALVAPADATFEWSAPPEATALRYFVPPPLPLPTRLYGATPEPFRFRHPPTATNPATAELTSEQLLGKPVVLVWCSEHPVCRPTLMQVDQVRQKWGEIPMYAVCTDPAEITDAQLDEQFREWGVELPFVRDLEAFGRDAFGVPNVPTLVVLNAAGELQVFDVGYNENLVAELQLVLEMLRRGEDVAAQVRARARNEQAAYRQDMIAAGARGLEAEFPVAPRLEPRVLRLEPRWSARTLKHPGNLVAYRQSGGTRIAILDGMRTVTTLDDRGEVVSSQELNLPEGMGVSLIRSNDAPPEDTARRFLVGAAGGQQWALFDAGWRRLTLHPEEPLHRGILSLQLAPHVAGDGAMVLTGYREAGLHAVDEQGQRVWVSRAIDSALSVDSLKTAGGHRVIAVDLSGVCHLLTLGGQPVGPPQRVGGMAIHSIAAARYPQQDGAIWCGLTYDALGRRVAVGLDERLRPLWDLSLSGGAFAQPVDFLVSGALLGRGFWVAVEPDGAIQLISADGAIRDRFQCGELVQGIGLTPDGQLIVATPTGVHCWSVSQR